MIFSGSLHKKFVLLALVATIALSLCPLDHLMPMAEAATHSDAAVAECMPNVCATLESKKIVSQEKATQTKLLFEPDPLFISFRFQTRIFRFRTIGDSAPPIFNTLYALHATYLI